MRAVLTTLLSLTLVASAAADTAPDSLARYLSKDTLAHLVVSPGLGKGLARTAPARIYSEEEVQLFVESINKVIGPSMTAYFEALGFHFDDLFRMFSGGEVSLTLTGISTNTNPVIDRLLIAAHGKQAAAAWDKMLGIALAEARKEMPRLKETRYSLKQCEVRSLRVGPVTFTQATYKGWYLLSTDAAALASLVSRLEKGPQADDSLAARPLYREVKQEATDGREGAFLFVDVKGLVDEILVGPLKAQRPTLVKFGVDKLEAIGIASVCTDTGFSERIVVRAPKATTGVFGLTASLPASDQGVLRMVPKEAVFCIAGAISPLDTATAYRELIGAVDAKQARELDAGVRTFEKAIGMKLPQLLSQIGPRFCLYLTMPRHEGLMPDLVLMVESPDPKMLRTRIDQLVARVTRGGDEVPALEIRKIPYTRGRTFELLELSRLGEISVVLPSWIIQDNWLVVGATPNALKEAWHRMDRIKAGTAKSLVDTPRWKRFVKQVDPNFGGLVYLDAGRLLTATYETVMPFFQAVIQRGDAPFDPALLPRPEVLARHLHGVGITTSRSEKGLKLELTSPIGLVPFVVFAGGLDTLQKLAKHRGWVDDLNYYKTQSTSMLVTFAYEGTSLADALDDLARRTGVEIRFSRSACEKIRVSGKGDKVALEKALQAIVPTAQLAYRMRNLPGGKLQVVVYPKAGE